MSTLLTTPSQPVAGPDDGMTPEELEARLQTIEDALVPFQRTEITLSTADPSQVVYSFEKDSFRSVKLLVQVSSSTGHAVTDLLIIHNDVTASSSVATSTFTDVDQGTIAVDISGTLVRVLLSPTNTDTSVVVVRTAVI